MTKDDVLSWLQQCFMQVAPEIDFAKINLDLPLRDQVEIDSLDLYNIIIGLEKKTGIHVPDSKLAVLLNLNELINYILNSKDSPAAMDQL